MQFFDPINLLILAMAVVIFLKLRSVLGTRTGTERPPFDPFAKRNNAPAEAQKPDNVIPMPRTPRQDAEAEAPPAVWAGIAEAGSPLATGLERIAAADPQFAPKPFLEGAKIAYESIVSAFAAGSKTELKPLLAREVMDSFGGAIDGRDSRGEKLELRFVGIDKAELTAADLAGKRAVLTVRFVSQQITTTTDKSGSVIDGDPKEIREITDVWRFERDVSARDPNWKLTATGDAD